jgi:hypothetical protein
MPSTEYMLQVGFITLIGLTSTGDLIQSLPSTSLLESSYFRDFWHHGSLLNGIKLDLQVQLFNIKNTSYKNRTASTDVNTSSAGVHQHQLQLMLLVQRVIPKGSWILI